MDIFRSIIINALIVGVVVGLTITSIQSQTIYPLILEAETFEEQTVHEQTVPEHQHTLKEDEEWWPENGFERTFYSALANIFISVVFCIFINIGFVFHSPSTLLQGAAWGLSGAFVFYIVPTLIYDPVIPGTIEADHFSRQLWWLATVECTAFGLAIIVFLKQYFLKAIGVVLIIVTLVVGAPPGEIIFHAPTKLVDIFILYNIFINTFHWVMLGVLSAFLYMKNIPANISALNDV